MSRIILMGGGAVAMEALTYARDISVDHPAHISKFAGYIDAGGGRQSDLSTVAGRSLAAFSEAEAVPDLAQSLVLICVGDPHVRRKLALQLLPRCAGLATLVHPSAYIASTAKIGSGAIIAPFAFVGPGATLGDNVLLNVRSTVGHDAEVGAHAVLSPVAAMNGFSRLGEAGFLGAGAIMLPSSGLGRFSKAAAGAIVKSIVGEGFLVHGSPATGRQMFRIPE